MLPLLLLLATTSFVAGDDCAGALRNSTLAQAALLAMADRIEQSVLPATQFLLNNRVLRFFASDSVKLGVALDLQLTTLPVRAAISSIFSGNATNSTSSLTRKGLCCTRVSARNCCKINRPEYTCLPAPAQRLHSASLHCSTCRLVATCATAAASSVN